MCLVTVPSPHHQPSPPSSSSSTHGNIRSVNNNNNNNNNNNSRMPPSMPSTPKRMAPLRNNPLRNNNNSNNRSKESLRQKSPSSKPNPAIITNKRSSSSSFCRPLWLFLVTVSCLTLYSLHKSTGTAISSVLKSEIEKESLYLSSLFRDAATTAQEYAGVAVAAGSSSAANIGGGGVEGGVGSALDEQRSLHVSLKDGEEQKQQQQSAVLSSDGGLVPDPTPAQPAVAANGIDFSNLEPGRNHAIMIPYRNRKFHLEQFIEHMGPYLKRNFPQDTFELWIMEQDDDFLFNRAWLTNVGIANIKQQNRLYEYQKQQSDSNSIVTVPPPPHCIILHDVDLIPTVDGVPYTNCSRPMQLGSELAHFNNSIPYSVYTGGVGPTMLLDHWTKINGMSNDFYGWGGEDDDLWHRLRLNGLLKKPVRRPIPAPSPGPKPKRQPKFWPPNIERPPKGKGKFRPISEAQTVHHNEKTHNQWNRIGFMLESMQNNSARWKRDGLSDMRMTITNDAMTVTHSDSVNFDNQKAVLDSNRTDDEGFPSTSQATTTTITRKHFVSAKQQGSLISSLAIAPDALACFAAIHHIKAIPKVTALEFIHVTQTDGGRIERAGAKAGISWGACHYHHALEVQMGCPDRLDPELEKKSKQRKSRASHTPWHSPLQDFEENPYRGRPTFAVVRNPYDRLLDYFYCPWNGYKGEQEPKATDLNLFLQNAMSPPEPPETEEEKKQRERKTQPPKPKPIPQAFLHLRPQFHYVFANNKIALYSKPFVTHVLHYETIEDDFQNLMQQYDLNSNVLLPERTASSSKHAKTLTPLNFDKVTLDMIHRFYAGDFRRFKYTQMQHEPNIIDE